MMKVKAGNDFKPGDMVTMKPQDYKAPHPTGEYLGFALQQHDMPIGVAIVLDDRIPEGEAHLIDKGSFEVEYLCKFTTDDET